MRYVNTLGNLFAIVTTLMLIAAYVMYGASTITCMVDGEYVEGCRVKVTGEYVGKTPLTTRLGPGWHTVEVEPPKGVLVSTKADTFMLLTTLLGSDFTAQFTSRSRVSNVRCLVDEVEVGGCLVEIDGTYAGETPLKVGIPAGTHRVVVVAPEEPFTAESELIWTIDSPDGASMKLDARFTTN